MCLSIFGRGAAVYLFKGAVQAGFIPKAAAFGNFFHRKCGAGKQQGSGDRNTLARDIFHRRNAKFLLEGSAEIGRVVKALLRQIFQGQLLGEVLVYKIG